MVSKNAKAPEATGISLTKGDLLNRPGTFLMIPTGELKVDSEYQRPLTGSRVDRLANDWNWIACGVLTVALRGPGSGDYYLIDGQHRWAAARRAEISELPCMVFETSEHTDEARGFLDANTNRKSMAVLDKYRAMLVIEDPVALKVKDLLTQANRDPVLSYSGRSNQPSTMGRAFNALDYLMSAVRTDSEAIERIWPLMIEVSDGRLLTKRLIQGFFYIERYLSNASITERLWRRRILQIGYDLLHKSIDETCSFEGRSGSAICAQGILRALNKGLRNKLRINVTQEPENQDE